MWEWSSFECNMSNLACRAPKESCHGHDPRITLFHAPNSRPPARALTLMEEIDVPYDLHLLSLGKN